MSRRRQDDPEWRQAARNLGSAFGGSARRLARGLRDIGQRPPDDHDDVAGDPRASESAPASDAAGQEGEDLGEKMKDLGRDFVDIMGKVSVSAGKSIRKAAWTAADTVRDTVKPDDK